MRKQDPRLPAEVESYLIGLYGQAGSLAGRAAGATGGAGAGARTARWLKTVIEDRIIVTAEQANELTARINQAFPRAHLLAANEQMIRLAIPVGKTGLQQVVVDLRLHPRRPVASRITPPGEMMIRAYGKEGLINRKPTARIADALADLLRS